MYTESDLKRQLADNNFLPWDTVFVHSSLKAIGAVEGGAETVLNALCDYFSDGLLIMPTHSWAAIGEKHYIFDPETEPSCVGVLTNLFMKRPGVFRSLHPTHSVAAIGAKAEEYVSGDENSDTPCPRNGCMGKLIDLRAKFLFIGCPLTKFTFIHGVEEWANIPDRIAKTPQALKIKMPDGTFSDRPMYRHSCSTGEVSQNYGKLKEPLIAKGIAHEGKFGDADCIIADAARTAEFVTTLLRSDPALFTDNSPVPEEYYAVRRRIKIAPSLLACDFTELRRELASVADADYIHIDVMDGQFVPNISFGVPVVAAVKRATELPLDVHLMIKKPSAYIKAFASAGADMISVHYETDEDLGELIGMIEAENVAPAVAIKPNTPVEVLFPYLERLKMILIMTVEPGFGGQTLNAECLKKARTLRNEIRKRGLSVEIEADGGINGENIGLVSASGVTLAVMGTAVFSQSDRSAFITRCKG